MGESKRHTFGRKGWCLNCGYKNTSAKGQRPCEPEGPPRRVPPPHPTVQVMDGETGESACLPGEDLYEAWQAALGTAETHYHFYDAVNGRGSFCPAPTPRAP